VNYPCILGHEFAGNHKRFSFREKRPIAHEGIKKLKSAERAARRERFCLRNETIPPSLNRAAHKSEFLFVIRAMLQDQRYRQMGELRRMVKVDQDVECGIRVAMVEHGAK